MIAPHSRHARLLTFLLLTAAALLLGTLAAHAQPLSRHLALGNPSNATADVNQPANYLIVRAQYALSYSRERGIPNWVSWHLQASDLGTTPRYMEPFITDTSLPVNWPRVIHDDYTNSGYDRGHMTPSADRTASVADYEATFILTNVLPQAPENNEVLWADLEAEARTLVGQGNELYIISGGAGSLGTLASGKLTIPTDVWKVMLVLSAADGDDAARVTAQTQAIAVWTPNDFPSFMLAAGAEVRVWTRAGTDDPANLYWGRAQAVWNNTGDTAILRDANGAETSRFTYP